MVVDLHDATFTGLSVDWATGAARLSFLRRDGPLTIVATEISRLSLPRRHPWGPSTSVNAASFDPFRIEMQSGDVIELDATSFVIE